ncbi:NlpC/P60 family protein [uncultured Polaribacter sp.]|uniref:C40 family peptidase n=1 Tax=uncultured Polaribacter sp. TaxID=174711 RepID=UPI002633EE51|nr:NlpC/P60 family protein [uncultured Polaribacter sp.]
MFGICNLSSAALRAEESNLSEMVSQVLFGETFKIIEIHQEFTKIELSFDNYQGFIDNKQYQQIPLETYEKLTADKQYLSAGIIDFITDKNNELTTIPLGANLPFFKNKALQINSTNYLYEGAHTSEKKSKKEIIKAAFYYLNSPFLLGGKTPFGIDSDGFTQMVYKLCGHSLLREAQQQATQGEVLSFIEESEPGDLAFFDNDKGEIIHVGIILNEYHIIHCYGKVRVDTLDHSGIYNADLQKHTHKLRIIKRMIG